MVSLLELFPNGSFRGRCLCGLVPDNGRNIKLQSTQVALYFRVHYHFNIDCCDDSLYARGCNPLPHSPVSMINRMKFTWTSVKYY